MYNLCELLSTNFTRRPKYDKMQKNRREAYYFMHPFIHIGNITLPMYGLCTMVGTIFALLAVFWLRKKQSPLSEDNLLDALIWAIVLGFLCSKLLYFIVDPPQMPHSWAEVWDLISAGLVFYGGLIGGLLGLVIVSRKTKKNIITFADLMVPCFCLAHAGGRVGCLMAGCCYGMEYNGPCAVVLDGVSRLPTQIMESAFLVLLFVVLTVIYLKKPRRGTVTGWYMVLYAVWRFIIEFFRADERGTVGPLSTSQFISLFIFAFGLFLLIRSRTAVNDFEPEPEPAPVPVNPDRPETAPLPPDPAKVNEEEEKRSEEQLPDQKASFTSDEPLKEVAEATELVQETELGGEVAGDASGNGDGGAGDGGDQ